MQSRPHQVPVRGAGPVDSFLPGDDGMLRQASTYDLRYRAENCTTATDRPKLIVEYTGG